MSIETPAAHPVMRERSRGSIGRLLIAPDLLSVVFLVVGVGLMAAAGIGPLDGGPSLDLGTLVADLVALDRPRTCGSGSASSSPRRSVRVAAAGIAYARQGQWTMVLVSIGILASSRSASPAPSARRSELDLVVLAIAFLIILLGAELFTNGIEWFGRKLELAEGAVGSVLAAVGTALPETMIPIIAILFASGEASHAVGIGAILGAPFMLATLAMFVTGIAVLASARRRRSTGDTMQVDTQGARPRHALLRDRLRARDRRRVPAPRAGLAQVDRRGRAHRHLRLVRQGPLRGRPRRGCGGPRAAPLPPGRPAGASRGPGGPAPACRQPAGPVLARPDRLGAVFFVDAVEHLASQLGDRRGPARAGDRADRDGAAREVQLDHLGPGRQGHAGHGQHHRGDGLPVDHPDRRRARVRVELVGRGAGQLHRRSPRRGSPSSHRP